MVSWLEFYNWILGPDGPSPKPQDYIIDNDEALDDFLDKWKRDNEKPSNSNRNRVEFNG